MRKFFNRVKFYTRLVTGFCVGYLTATGCLAVGMTRLTAFVVSNILLHTYVNLI
jgi:hypothetical protein